MPLDTNKIAHIQSVTLKTFQGRQKTVIFVYQNVGGSGYTYTAVQVIFRPQSVVDPEIPSGVLARQRSDLLRSDMLMVAPITTNFTAVVIVADTTTATANAVAAAQKYQIIEAVPRGIVPGGTHYVVQLRRFR